MRCELGSGGVSPGPSSEPSWSARRGQGRCQVGLTRSRAALGIAERSRKPVQPAEPWGERVGGRGPPPEPPQCGARWQQRGLEVAGVTGAARIREERSQPRGPAKTKRSAFAYCCSLGAQEQPRIRQEPCPQSWPAARAASFPPPTPTRGSRCFPCPTGITLAFPGSSLCQLALIMPSLC